MKALNFIYDQIVEDIPSFAEEYFEAKGDTDAAIDSIIRWQTTKNTTTGFVTGLPGGAAILVSLPASVTSSMCVQVRMVAAIAYLRGYDPKSDKVRTMVYCVMCGNRIEKILKKASIHFSGKITKTMIKSISGKTLTAINRAVGFRLATKFGEKGIVNLGKLVPVAGGVVGGAVDGCACYSVGKLAKKTF